MSNYYYNPGGGYNAQYTNDQYNDQEYYYDESNQQYDYYQQDSGQYYDEQQQQPSHHYDEQQPYQDQQYEQAATYAEPSPDTTDSLFYACSPPLTVHNYGYDTQGDPISAIAFSRAADTKPTYRDMGRIEQLGTSKEVSSSR